MAKKRMINPEIIDTDAFLEMPRNSRLLYYDFNVRADDDGFVGNPKKIMKAVGCNEVDYRVLIKKKYILQFNSGVIVIRHWKLHNYIRKDRYTPTIYTDEKKQLITENNGIYNLCHTNGIPGGIPDDIPLVDTDKIRLDKIRLDKNSIVVDRNNIENINTKVNNKEQDNLFNLIENIFGRTLASSEYEVINGWEDNDLTRYAIKQAEIARAFNVRYIESILNSYSKDNIQTVAEAEERDRKFRKRKNRGRYKLKSEQIDDYVEQLSRERGEI